MAPDLGGLDRVLFLAELAGVKNANGVPAVVRSATSLAMNWTASTVG